MPQLTTAPRASYRRHEPATSHRHRSQTTGVDQWTSAAREDVAHLPPIHTNKTTALLQKLRQKC
ncbi:hypothetical protein AN958_01373 [Leucoagaricus sp. SymC.cos]|nr:hypothetical protein AN958_01373 [Leucoagaricus sp. SymC.cos]